MALCGYYVCRYEYPNEGVYSGVSVNSSTWCNNKVECHNGGVDEKYCTEEEEMFECYEDQEGIDDFIIMSKVCDRKCDCKYCDDEWRCGGYIYHHWYTCSNTEHVIPSNYFCDKYKDCYHGDDESDCEENTICATEGNSIYTYKLANYSRCTAMVLCANKRDHTNCTDTRLAPLMCPVGGDMSTISQYILCKKEAYTYGKLIHSNTSAVCDDGMDVECVTPTPGCYIHKHQLCNNITDCKGGSDEKSTLCYRVSTQNCKRKYDYNTSLKIPKLWVMDGMMDCVNGIDEDIKRWNSCEYPKFTSYGAEHCEDVYVCPSGYPLFVEITSICDVLLSCQGGTEICNPEMLTSSHLRYTPTEVENVKYVHYCLLGLEDLYPHIASCEHVTHPTTEILGAQPNYLYLPKTQVSCKYLYGEPYVFLSCSGKCFNARCPLTSTPLSGSTCDNILRRKTYSLSSSGSLVLVKKEKKHFSAINTFVCGNGRCVYFSKVCNLIDDCGDGTDEDSCVNHFICNVKSNYSKSYIALSSVCDGKNDCLDSSDESSCCHRQLIDDLILKISSWLIGTLSLLLNGVTQVRTICTIKRVRTSTALADKVLITLINFGDWLVGSYLFALAVIDVYFGSSFCLKQIDWLLSSSCSILGVVSTAGSQVSLFSMTILSATRLVRISKGLRYLVRLTKNPMFW